MTVMMKRIFGMAALAVVSMTLAAISGSCSHKSNAPVGNAGSANVDSAVPVSVGTTAYIPRATVFRMSGPYADHVAVTLDASGQLTYYPDPSDISDNSVPVYLGDGWWLNRQGLGANSVFTTWTMQEYAKLPSAPTPAEIKAHIMPDAAVTDFRSTSVLLPNAMKELSKIKAELPR